MQNSLKVGQTLFISFFSPLWLWEFYQVLKIQLEYLPWAMGFGISASESELNFITYQLSFLSLRQRRRLLRSVVIVPISRGVPEKTDPTEIYFKKLSHTIVEAGKSEICKGRLASWKLKQELTLQSGDKFLLQESFVLKVLFLRLSTDQMSFVTHKTNHHTIVMLMIVCGYCSS